MKQYIEAFLDEKQLAANSRLAYLYDLQQFLDLCQGQINPSKTAIYQAFLQEAKPGVQKRKLSAVNQFLYFLYENGHLHDFYRLKTPKSAPSSGGSVAYQSQDISCLWEDSPFWQGQLIALLVVSLGLTPSEIGQICQEDLDLNFGILTIKTDKGRRVLKLPRDLLPFLQGQPEGRYLFDKKGKPYSRQWLFNRLSEFVHSLGHKEWTAQKLRQQYILGQIAAGRSLEDLAKQLGLRSPISLEKYR